MDNEDTLIIRYDHDLNDIIPEVNGFIQQYGLEFKRVPDDGYGEWIEFELVVSPWLTEILNDRREKVIIEDLEGKNTGVNVAKNIECVCKMITATSTGYNQGEASVSVMAEEEEFTKKLEEAKRNLKKISPEMFS